MTIKNKFDIGQLVYLITDPEQYKRHVVGITAYANNILYILQCAEASSEHYDFEITTERQVI